MAAVDNFSAESQAVLDAGAKEAQERGNDSFGTEHLLLGLLADRTIFPALVLLRHITYEQAGKEVNKVFSTANEYTRGRPSYTPRMKEVLELALRSSVESGSRSVEPLHLALGLLTAGEAEKRRSGVASKVLETAGVDREEIEKELLNLTGSNEDDTSEAPPS